MKNREMEVIRADVLKMEGMTRRIKVCFELRADRVAGESETTPYYMQSQKTKKMHAVCAAEIYFRLARLAKSR